MHFSPSKQQFRVHMTIMCLRGGKIQIIEPTAWGPINSMGYLAREPPNFFERAVAERKVARTAHGLGLARRLGTSTSMYIHTSYFLYRMRKGLVVFLLLLQTHDSTDYSQNILFLSSLFRQDSKLSFLVSLDVLGRQLRPCFFSSFFHLIAQC